MFLNCFLLDASIEKSPVKIEDSSSNSSVVFEQNDKTIDADLSNLSGRVFLRSLFRSLEIGSGSDQDAIFSILLLFAIKSNKGEVLRLFFLSQKVFFSYFQILAYKAIDRSYQNKLRN